MHKISLEDVRYVAELAQLELDDETKQRMREDLADILQYFAKLDELDTAGIEPMMHVLPLGNVYRQDQVKPWLTQEQALENAPQTDGEYFLVPRILDTE